jgi:hypothetical protein
MTKAKTRASKDEAIVELKRILASDPTDILARHCKTLKTYTLAGQQCRVMVLNLKDGTKHIANFKFTKQAERIFSDSNTRGLAFRSALSLILLLH